MYFVGHNLNILHSVQYTLYLFILIKSVVIISNDLISKHIMWLFFNTSNVFLTITRLACQTMFLTIIELFKMKKIVYIYIFFILADLL